MVAREEFQELSQPVWTEEDEIILFRFNKHYSLFEKNWDLQHPLPNDTWRTTPFGELSTEDLWGLSATLEEFGQECLQWLHSGRIRPNLYRWIILQQRVFGP